MELIEMQKYYDVKSNSVGFILEISYSTGRTKQRELIYKLPLIDGLIWDPLKNSFAWDHPMSFEVNYLLLRLENYIKEVFKEKLKGDIGFDEIIETILTEVAKKEDVFSEVRELNTGIKPFYLPRTPIIE